MSLHPLAERARQSARPMPDPPPVTSTVLLAQSMLTSVSSSCDILNGAVFSSVLEYCYKIQQSVYGF